MTALSEYARLEATGLWRATPDAQRVEVIVSVGDATLTISDRAERALSHWSLAAIHRLNVGKRPALFAPSGDPDEAEELEIGDDQMIDAIEKVRKTILKRRPHRGRLRTAITLTLAAALGLAAITWLPGALTRQTLALLPAVTRDEVGNRLLTRIERVAGSRCSTGLGAVALDRLSARVLGPDAARVVIVSDAVTRSTHLPGDIIVLNRSLVEAYDEPDVAAGHILAEALRALVRDPMRDLLDDAGMIATVKLLTSGTIAPEVLDAHAEHLLTTPPITLAPEVLLAGFDAARLRSTPYAFALDPSGESVLPLIEADPVPMSEAAPLIPDSAWVSLQGICRD